MWANWWRSLSQSHLRIVPDWTPIRDWTLEWYIQSTEMSGSNHWASSPKIRNVSLDNMQERCLTEESQMDIEMLLIERSHKSFFVIFSTWHQLLAIWITTNCQRSTWCQAASSSGYPHEAWSTTTSMEPSIREVTLEWEQCGSSDEFHSKLKIMKHWSLDWRCSNYEKSLSYTPFEKCIWREEKWEYNVILAKYTRSLNKWIHMLLSKDAIRGSIHACIISVASTVCISIME